MVSDSDYSDSINLFSRVLLNGCNHLFKRGRDRNYIEVTEDYRGVKGKIEFHESLNKNLFKLGRSICTFDQFDFDILQNQLLKATL
jgi:5-methylcytosine-specific restriction enzyme subunit McrC